ncbi:uncharacterized protein LOC107413971 isoform X4 [Ziziphus jujuba]|uniref:Uncharacterized protein LOC107413971 isoform X4 n=1 Tax=Ziziphus jujuba TaxID=326968 RepID=A0ABM4AEW6_ZIZJJ|nr:uncharacterized protein LOC107413971 isoform X4 [Ziziphus jujuba]
MRNKLASQLTTYYYTRRNFSSSNLRNLHSRNFSSFNGKDEVALEQDAERKIGWLLKLFFAGTATFVGYQFFPYLDERRMKIVEMGGARELLNMLEAAKDDRTRKEALKALSALSQSEEAVGALNHAGAISIIRSTPDSSEDADVEKYKSNLMKRFKDLRYVS